MSLLYRVAHIEARVDGPLGCTTCRSWPTPHERVLRLFDDEAHDPWRDHGRCPDCGRRPDRISLVDLIRGPA